MKKIIFDVDDILWPLNRKMAEMANIDYSKIITYDINKNPLLTSDEKHRIADTYGNPTLFEDIEWYDGIELINNLNANIGINSNVYSETIGDMKLKQLKRVLTIPDENIRMNLVTADHHRPKSIEDDIYIFIDDNPNNILHSNAKYNIMLACPWNTTDDVREQIAQCGKNIIVCETLKGIIDLINNLLDENSLLTTQLNQISEMKKQEDLA